MRLAPPYRSPAPREVDEPLPSAPASIGAYRRSHRALTLWQELGQAIVVAALFLFVGVAIALAGVPLAVAIFMVIVFAIFAMIAFAIFGWRKIRERVETIDVHADGLAIVRHGIRGEVAFEDVHDLWCRIEMQSSAWGRYAGVSAVRLTDRAGKVHVVTFGVEDAVGLLRRILERCSEPLVDEAIAALAEGQVLTFAHVRVTRDDIVIGRRRRAWRDVHLVRLHPGRVALFGRRLLFPLAVVRWDKIPHPFVFTRVVQHLAPRVDLRDPFSRAANRA